MTQLKKENLVQQLFIISLWIVAILMISMSFWYGITGDEPGLNNYGKAIWRYLSSFGADEFVFSKDPSFDSNQNINYYGGLFELLSVVVNKISPLEEFTTRHILNACCGFLCILYSARTAKLLGGHLAGLFTIWLMFLAPFFLGNAMNNPKDIPFAATYIMSIYYSMRLIHRLPNPNKLDYLWAILCIGAAINIRVGGILLIAYLFAYAGLYYIVNTMIQKEKIALGSLLKAVFITSILGYIAGLLLWPYALEDPINNPLTALSEMSNFKTSLAQLFEGEKVFSADLPSHFLPKSFFITNPYVIHVGLFFSLLYLWFHRKSKQLSVLLFIFFTALFPIAYILYGKSNIYHVWRHELFVFPSIAILASLGWQSIVSFFENKKLKLAGFALLAIFLLEPLYFVASTFPQTITYYNATVGGVQGAYGDYEVDFYYNGLKECVDWFKKNELPKLEASNDTVRIVSNANHIMQEYFPKRKGNIIIEYIRYPERNQKAWDYAFFHIALIPQNELKSRNWLPPSTTLYETKVFDKTLCAILKKPSNDDIKAQNFLKNNQIDSAIVYYKKYLSKDAQNASVLSSLGNLYLQLGQQNDAASYIEKSYQLDPNNIESAHYLGMLRMQQGKLAEAQTLFTKVIQANPNAITEYYFLGMCQAQMNQLDAAISNLNTASQEPSLQQACYKLMGDIYMQKGNVEQANKLYQAASLK
ncbi:MAG: tetratricopeptide repeat protein [Chitinophagaceae bacterium]